ncbi:MAG: AMP-binding protein [Acidimicrobiia bacterium]|nr:AMP-binding protein [Acidimicrobiia bacterium]
MDHVDRWNILEPDTVAVEFPDGAVTYRELSTLVSRGSGALAGYGVKPGDRVAVWVKNDLPSLVALWAVPRMGAVVVPISSRLSHPQVMAQLDLVDPALILGNEALTGRETVGTESLFDGRPSMPAPHAPDDLHSIFFTSGSAGEPKGVRLTWGNHESSAAASAGRQPVGPDDRWLAVLPLFHVGGFAVTYRMFRAGGTVVLETEFDAMRVATALDSVSYASLVPTMLREVLVERVGGFEGDTRAVLVGGARVPVELQESARAAGLRVVATYGMTETASQIATAVPDDPPGSGARPLDTVELSAGSSGSPADIVIDGPMVSPGYWGEPDRDGPFETRDVGYLDDAGRLHVIGRSDDVIISGGENIHPAEVERGLESVEAVRAAAAFGIPDEVWGERLEAAVVLADETATVESIEAELRGLLPGFKIPKRLHVVAALPLGPTGKVDRKALVEMADHAETESP